MDYNKALTGNVQTHTLTTLADAALANPANSAHLDHSWSAPSVTSTSANSSTSQGDIAISSIIQSMKESLAELGNTDEYARRRLSQALAAMSKRDDVSKDLTSLVGSKRQRRNGSNGCASDGQESGVSLGFACKDPGCEKVVPRLCDLKSAITDVPFRSRLLTRFQEAYETTH